MDMSSYPIIRINYYLPYPNAHLFIKDGFTSNRNKKTIFIFFKM
jgi:hypothetical protein